jgi:hypothetical protein
MRRAIAVALCLFAAGLTALTLGSAAHGTTASRSQVAIHVIPSTDKASRTRVGHSPSSLRSPRRAAAQAQSVPESLRLRP